jgi:hypothetical protein
MTRARDIANLVDENGDIVADALDNASAVIDSTATPSLTLASSVNENSVTNGTFTSASNSITTIIASSGTISNVDNSAKTFTYTAPDITDSSGGNDDISVTITAFSTRGAEVTSASTTLNVSVLEVVLADDDAVSVASYQSSEFSNDGFNY